MDNNRDYRFSDEEIIKGIQVDGKRPIAMTQYLFDRHTPLITPPNSEHFSKMKTPSLIGIEGVRFGDIKIDTVIQDLWQFMYIRHIPPKNLIKHEILL